MATREPERCRDAARWLTANKHSLAPLTGQDWRALQAFAHLVDLYTSTDNPDVALVGMAAAAASMQHSTRHLCRELIAWAMDWDDRARLWPQVEQAIEAMRAAKTESILARLAALKTRTPTLDALAARKGNNGDSHG